MKNIETLSDQEKLTLFAPLYDLWCAANRQKEMQIIDQTFFDANSAADLRVATKIFMSALNTLNILSEVNSLDHQ